MQNPTSLQCGNGVTCIPASCLRLMCCILAVVIVTGQELDARLLLRRLRRRLSPYISRMWKMVVEAIKHGHGQTAQRQGLLTSRRTEVGGVDAHSIGSASFSDGGMMWSCRVNRQDEPRNC